MGRELKAADIARRHGVDRTTAYRWLVEIEKKYGPSVVGRRGKRGVLVTTEDAFGAVVPLVASSSAVEQRLRELEARIEDVERRADRQAEALSDLRRDVAVASFARRK